VLLHGVLADDLRVPTLFRGSHPCGVLQPGEGGCAGGPADVWQSVLRVYRARPVG
jgi:hypothetical protein